MKFFNISLVTNLNDSGDGSFRKAIRKSNKADPNKLVPFFQLNTTLNVHAAHINEILNTYNFSSSPVSLIIFTIEGTIKLHSTLPDITSKVLILSIPKVFPVTINCNCHQGLTLNKGSSGSIIVGLTIINSISNGLNLYDDKNIVVLCTIKKNEGNGIFMTSDYNQIGLNPNNFSHFVANKISSNKKNGIKLSNSNYNTIVKNKIVHNSQNGIYLKHSSNNTIGGTVYTNAAGETNNPTGSEGTVTPVFIIPPLGNQISKNKGNGVYLNRKSDLNFFHGNFIGTNYNGNKARGNELNGILILDSHFNAFRGCDFDQDPFVYYNVVSGNKLNGFHVKDSNGTVIQGNFSGINAQNAFPVANGLNGLLVSDTSDNTIVGGPIPLGNNFSGNSKNGIKVTDEASGFLSYNSFCGLAAFGGAVPNGRNGMLITSSGLNNKIQTNVVSGNLRNGIKLSGLANHINLDPNLCGTTSNGESALPNAGSGLVLSGQANNNFIGSQITSVIPNSTFSSNKVNGITIKKCAHDNVIYHCNIGISTAKGVQLNNDELAVLLTESCYQNVIVDCTISGNVLLKECAKNNKIIANPLFSDTDHIINKSNQPNLIVPYAEKLTDA